MISEYPQFETKLAASAITALAAATHFHTIVNLKTAKTIGVDIPRLLLAAANEVIV